jgi:hypothetical protein
MRDITKATFFKIFDQNTAHKSGKFKDIDSIAMSSYEAFIYSTITGAGYLDNLVMPFTPKGLMKIFQSQDNLNLVTGLWDRFHPYFTPRKISDRRKYISKGEKFVVPVEFDNESEYIEKIQKLYYAQDFPGQFLIQRIEQNKRGSGLESFVEYFACQHFKSRGYLVDNQFPLSQAYGSPDWIAVNSNVAEFKVLRNKGFFLFELAIPEFFEKKHLYESELNLFLAKSIVGEVKVVASNSTPQLEKYLKTQFFDSGVLCFTDRYRPNKSHDPIAYFDSDWTFVFESDSQVSDYRNDSQYEKFMKFILLNMKLYLLSALPDDFILKMLGIDNFDEIGSKSDFIFLLEALDIERIIQNS